MYAYVNSVPVVAKCHNISKISRIRTQKTLHNLDLAANVIDADTIANQNKTQKKAKISLKKSSSGDSEISIKMS